MRGPAARPHGSHAKKRERGAYVLTVVPEPGVDAIRSLRWGLKSLLRRHGLRCVDLHEAAGDGSPVKHEKETSSGL
jgi:hypothetical protein